MRQILLTIFVLFLVGCNQTEKFSKTEDLSIVEKTHHTVNDLIIVTSSDNTNNKLTGSEVVNVNQDVGNIFINQVERNQSLLTISEEFKKMHDEIFLVWNTNFTPLYNTYLYEDLEVDVAAAEIASLNETYVELETEIESIASSDLASEEERDQINEICNDLLMAISNRLLAIIEFKSMVGDASPSHQAFMDIHIENSNRYLNKVQKNSDALVADIKDVTAAK